MELGKQIKYFRERNGMSQEKLAEEIFVSRQSISNWENEKSYPDIHNILRLSSLFDVSLDELVKGDVDQMKDEITRSKLNFWSKCMLAAMVLMALSIGPVFKYLGLPGLIIPLLFAVMMFVSAVQTEKLKKKNNIQTYAEILAYMENREYVRPGPEKGRKLPEAKIVKMLAGAVAALLLIGIGMMVFLF